MTRHNFARAVAAIAAATLAMPAAAQAPEGLSVSPSRIAKNGVRTVSSTITIANNQSSAVAAAVTVSVLGHDLDGTPQFPESAVADASIDVARDPLRIEPRARRRLPVRVTLPSRARSFYGAVVVEYRPADAASGTSVGVRQRIATQILVRGPKPWRRAVRVEGTGVLPAANDSVMVYALVRNTGNVHVQPRGIVRIRQGSRLLARLPLQRRTVLPGYVRRFAVPWEPTERLAGPVTIEAIMSGPSARGSETVRFDRGRPRQPSGRIISLQAAGDPSPRVLLAFQNSGPVTLDRPVVTFAVRQGAFERARVDLPQPRLRRRHIREIAWSPDLSDGAYEVLATLRVGDSVLDQRVAGMRIGASSDPVEERARSSLIALALFLVLVVGGLLMWRARVTRTAAP